MCQANFVTLDVRFGCTSLRRGIRRIALTDVVRKSRSEQNFLLDFGENSGILFWLEMPSRGVVQW
ncbi:MAG: hypothetical protein H7308_03990 [Chthonomonadaceae bacterium]|nr:hypothetical protein [Chthonomonadaceae bacterium]